MLTCSNLEVTRVQGLYSSYNGLALVKSPADERSIHTGACIHKSALVNDNVGYYGLYQTLKCNLPITLHVSEH